MKNICNLLRRNCCNFTAELGEEKPEEVGVDVEPKACPIGRNAGFSFHRKSIFIRGEVKSMDERRWSQKTIVVNHNLLGKGLSHSKWNLLQLTTLVLTIVALVCTLTLRSKRLFDLEWWRWELMIAVVICGRLVSLLGILILLFFMKCKQYFYFVDRAKKPAQNCVWSVLTFIAWQCVLLTQAEHGKKVRPYATRICICAFLGTAVWLLKALLIEVLVSHFHVNRYFDRIKDSLFSQYVMETLSGPPERGLQNAGASLPLQPMADMSKGFKSRGALGSPPVMADENGSSGPPKIQYLKHVMNGFKSRGKPGLPLQRTADMSKSRRTLRSTPAMADENGSPGPLEIQKVIVEVERRLQGVTKLHNGGATDMFRGTGTPGSDGNGSARKHEDGIPIDHLLMMNRRTISAWNMNMMMDVVSTNMLTTFGEASTPITTEGHAKSAAEKIFRNVAKPGSIYIYPDDLKRFLSNDQALKAIQLFGGANETKRTSKQALENWVLNVFRERRALVLSLEDIKPIVEKVQRTLDVVLMIMIFMLCIPILDIATANLFTFLSSILVLASFVFVGPFKLPFESLMFVFGTHPFDVGDRCKIDDDELVVEKMSILYTDFFGHGNKLIRCSNNVLSTKSITNYRRSPHMHDDIRFGVNVSPSTKRFITMEEKIKSYVEDNQGHWKHGLKMMVRGVEDSKWQISLWVSHQMNFQDMEERLKRRALLVKEMIKVFKELDIKYSLDDDDVDNLPVGVSDRSPLTWTI